MPAANVHDLLQMSITDDLGPPGSIIEGRRERVLAVDLGFSIRLAVQASDYFFSFFFF